MMSRTLTSAAGMTAQQDRPWARTASVALAVLVVAAVSAWWGAYGGSHPSAEQEAAVPFLIGVDVIAAVVVFGAVVPWAGRPGKEQRLARFGLGLGIIGLLLVPVVFWSGVPLIIAAGGIVLGDRGRRAGRDAGRGTGMSTAAVVIAVITLIAAVAMLVLGNTVLT